MNERIKELTGKALDQAVPYTWTSLMPHELDKFAEQFAELIVRECAKFAEQYIDERCGRDYCVGVGVKKHFGVEE